MFYHKLGQRLLQTGAASLLQIGASVVKNWGSYYKLGQPLLQNRAAITNYGNRYYKIGQLLQIMAIVTNLGIAGMHWIIDKHVIFLSQFLQQKKLKKIRQSLQSPFPLDKF